MARVWAEIDTGAYAHNLNELKRELDDGVLVQAVVKADGYGLGAARMAGELVRAGVDRLAVATVEEGVQLREAGFECPIQVLGSVLTDEIGLAIVFDLILSVTSVQEAREIVAAAKGLYKSATVHLKIETGMGRFGLIGDEILDAWYILATSGRIEVEGAYTHMHSANRMDNDSALHQAARLSDVRKWLNEFRIRIPIWHASASAGAVLRPTTRMDMIRPGILLHGVRNWTADDGLDLKPAFSMHARISSVRRLAKGKTIGYEATRTLARDSYIATLTMGYADGYYRELSNSGEVIVEGVRCPIVGTICMDAVMIDVTDAIRAGKSVERGTIATLVGENGGERITLEEVAAAAGANPYAITCTIGQRTEKRYIRSAGMRNVTEVDFRPEKRKAG